MQSANMINTPMNEEEAIKILNVDVELEQEKKLDYILQKYVKLFNKNNLTIGGSPYIQSKVFNAKQFLMVNHKDYEN